MFAKLRTTKFLKIAANATSAIVLFDDSVQHIAWLHHYGLRDRVNKNGCIVKYSRRILLGIKKETKTVIISLLIDELSK